MWGRVTDGTGVNFQTFAEMEAHASYDDFVSISVASAAGCVPSRWPLNLQILRLDWCGINSIPHKTELCDVLRSEIVAGHSLCFTGRFTRVLNTFSGFVDGISVGVSDNEQLQSRVGAVWKRLEKGRMSVDDAIVEVRAILKDHDVSDDVAKVWIEPFQDYLAPDSSAFVFFTGCIWPFFCGTTYRGC